MRLQEFILWTKQFDTVFLVGMSEKTDKGIFFKRYFPERTLYFKERSAGRII